MSFLAANVGMPSKALSRVLRAATDLPLPDGCTRPFTPRHGAHRASEAMSLEGAQVVGLAQCLFGPPSMGSPAPG
jgi:hypothetical protein